MKQIKIFNSSSEAGIEKEINDFLEERSEDMKVLNVRVWGPIRSTDLENGGEWFYASVFFEV